MNNNFGERIYNLRISNNMSQGNLADRLGVSRQTVSKWENNICMPETDKLILLSEIFQVSTDYILKGDEEQPKASDTIIEIVPHTDERIIKKYVGIVLAIIFFLIAIFILLMGGSFLAIPAAAIGLLGVLFALNIKHPWLIISWITYIISISVLPFFTSLSMHRIFDPVIYQKGYTLHLILNWLCWILLFILIAATVKIKRGYIFRRKNSEE